MSGFMQMQTFAARHMIYAWMLRGMYAGIGLRERLSC